MKTLAKLFELEQALEWSTSKLNKTTKSSKNGVGAIFFFEKYDVKFSNIWQNGPSLNW